jgi:Fic family protein
MALARADGLRERFYSLSGQLEAERREYYDQLEHAQRGGLDITDWLNWFLGSLDRSFDSAERTLVNVLFKAKVWNSLNQKPVNERQREIVNLMLDEGFQGYMNTSKYAKVAKCSTDTALRDIRELEKWEVLLQNPGGGRSTSYRLTPSSDFP